MAQRLLDSLQKVPKDQLPSGAECMICKEEYGTVPSDNGTIEHAVWLPCLHHVGSECIAIWLSPGDGLGNSCPLCRTVFFENYLRDYDDDEEEDGDGYGDSDDDDEEEEEEEDGDDEEDEDGSEGNDDEDEAEEGDDPEDRRRQTSMTPVADSQSPASSPVTTPSQQQQTESQQAEAPFHRRPLQPTTRQIEDDQNRAPSQLLPSPPASSSAFPPQKNPSAQTKSPPPPIMADLKTALNQLACASLTLAFSPASSSMILVLIGARIPPSGDMKSGGCGLSMHQEEMLWRELRRHGVRSQKRWVDGWFLIGKTKPAAHGAKEANFHLRSATGSRRKGKGEGLGLRTELRFRSDDEGRL